MKRHSFGISFTFVFVVVNGHSDCENEYKLTIDLTRVVLGSRRDEQSQGLSPVANTFILWNDIF